MISLLSHQTPIFLANLILMLHVAVRTVHIPVITRDAILPPDKRTPFVYGTIILMIAFLLSLMILAIGGRLFGADPTRVKVGISFGFFAFCFITVVVYYNLRRWLGVEDGL